MCLIYFLFSQDLLINDCCLQSFSLKVLTQMLLLLSFLVFRLIKVLFRIFEVCQFISRFLWSYLFLSDREIFSCFLYLIEFRSYQIVFVILFFRKFLLIRKKPFFSFMKSSLICLYFYLKILVLLKVIHFILKLEIIMMRLELFN